MLRTGRGQDKDLAQSLLWLQRAAAQGHVSAVAALASWQAATPP
jgi:TPR repeat protein